MYEKTPHFVEGLVLARELEIHIYPELKSINLFSSHAHFLDFGKPDSHSCSGATAHVFQSQSTVKIVLNRSLTTSVL